MGMKVHVTGARGFVGSFLTGALREAGHELVDAPPGAQAVVHLAGIAHRRASAQELDAANVRLAEHVAREAAAADAHFVFMSSVKVHGETSDAPLRESSPLAPATRSFHHLPARKRSCTSPPSLIAARVARSSRMSTCASRRASGARRPRRARGWFS